MAMKALRVGAIVFLAPILFLLEFANERRLAPSAHVLRYTMLGAPPVTMIVTCAFPMLDLPVLAFVVIVTCVFARLLRWFVRSRCW